MKKIAILQSNYIPWKGYFDIIANVDAFVFLDDVQYTKNDWRNRNMIKTSNGPEWLTVPVRMTGKFGQRICETEVTDHRWVAKHLATIKQNYSKSLHFGSFFPLLEKTFHVLQEEKLISNINQHMIHFLCKQLGIQTEMIQSTDLFSLEKLSTFDPNTRIIEVCKALQANVYLSGPAAKSYMDMSLFKSNSIEVLWTNYANYPEYAQLYPPFSHQVSVIDLIFNEGDKAMFFFKGPSLTEN